MLNRGILKNKWNRASMQAKLTLSFTLTVVIILAINIFMFMNINSMIAQVDKVYVSNANLNDLLDALTNVETCMKDYLDTKSSDALDSYYRADQNYRDLLEGLNTDTINNKRLIMEKNIYEQSQTYLQVVYDTIQAKRGRNVEKYKAYYESAEIIYKDIQNCMFSLNNEQFKYNANSYRVLLSSLRYVEIVSTFILCFIGIVNLLMIILLTRNMTLPLKHLAKAANEVAKGNFEIEITTQENEDEVGVMSKAFQKMVTSIQAYIIEIRQSMERESQMKERELVMESRVKEAQLVSLQAQINPHFLFNTLNAGAQLAMMEGADKTTEFIENVAAFFRLNMKKMNEDTTIGEEVQLVDHYIYILNVRFTGEIRFEKQIDESLLNVKMPSMILQPLVENAVNYGIRDIDWEGKITLRIYRQNDMAYLEVADNGKGMTKEKVEEILSGNIKTSSTNGNGIGIGNVIERVRIFTGREQVYTVQSEGIGMGSTFTIQLPLYR